MASVTLTPEEVARYGRHLVMPEVVLVDPRDMLNTGDPDTATVAVEI